MRKWAFLLLASGSVWRGGEYIDAQHFFRLRVPAGYRISTGPEKQNDSYLPVCLPTSTICFEFPLGRYSGTNLGSASVEVTVLNAKTAETCLHPGKYTVSRTRRRSTGSILDTRSGRSMA